MIIQKCTVYQTGIGRHAEGLIKENRVYIRREEVTEFGKDLGEFCHPEGMYINSIEG